MEVAHKDFLEANIGNWHTIEAGFVRNLELPELQMYEHIYRTYLDPNFILTVWCGSCKYDMIKRVYKYYFSLPEEVVQNYVQENVQPIESEPIAPAVKKRGRPKK